MEVLRCALPSPSTNHVPSQIQDLTPLLPHRDQLSLADLGQVLETLVVRRSEDLPFVRANERHQLSHEPAVVRSRTRLATFIVLTLKTDPHRRDHHQLPLLVVRTRVYLIRGRP